MSRPPGTLVFDGDCGFCTRSADWVATRSDAAVEPWQRLDLAAHGLTEDEVRTAAYWLDPDGGEPLRGARAVAAALRACGRPWRGVGVLLDLPPLRPLSALGYRVVAANRHRLPGTTPACRR